VRAQDTWYGLAKRYLNTEIAVLKRLNPDTPFLKPGNRIKLGYLSTAATASATQANSDTTTLDTTATGTTILRSPEQQLLYERFSELAAQHLVLLSNGMTVWRGGSSDAAFFALHPSAEIGSIIEIENPHHKIKVYAKVIGRIPVKAYPEHVKMVVSPAVASQLGALDRQFYTRARYIPHRSY